MSQPNLQSNNPAEDIAPLSPFGDIDYGVTRDYLQNLAARFEGITSVIDRKGYDKAQAAVTTLTRARTSIEARRVVLKKESLDFGRLVDSTGKELMAVVEPEETRIKALLEVVKAQKAAEKAERERIEQARVDTILNAIAEVERMPSMLQHAPSADVLEARNTAELLAVERGFFEEFEGRAVSVREAVIAELDELYAGALHDENVAKRECEAQEKLAEEQKAEAKRLAQERADLDAKQAEINAEQQRKADELAAQQKVIDDERQRIEDDKRAEAQRLEDERLAKEQAEADAQAKKERQEQEERTKPDREKLYAFTQALDAIAYPEFTSKEARELTSKIDARMASAIHSIEALADEL